MSFVMNNLSAQNWFCAEETRNVMSALAAKGRPARFVGGCVRDALLGRTIHDIDIATPEHPHQVMDLLENAGIRAIATGIDHGTITAVINQQHFEITTLRRDVSSDGRHARVAFSESWEEDAARRDFTMNAMSLDGVGKLYDYFDGLKDLKAGRVRFVGDAHQRIEEDYLRLLRFFRFSAHYGQGHVDPSALAACRDLAQGVELLSGERISQEFLKVLGADTPHQWLTLMQENNVLIHVLPEAMNLQPLETLCVLEEQPDPLRRLAILLPDDEGIIKSLVKRWRLSNVQKSRLINARLKSMTLSSGLSRSEVRSLLFQKGAMAVRDHLYIATAMKQATELGPFEQQCLYWIAQWETNPAHFPLQGHDLMDAGYKPGPELGRKLQAVQDWWCAQGCGPDRVACLAYLNDGDQSGE